MNEAKKLSLGRCRGILEKNGDKYSDEQVLKIRDILYDLGELDYLVFKDIQKTIKNVDLFDECNKAA